MNSVRWIFNPEDKRSYQDKLYSHNQNEVYLNYITDNFNNIIEYQTFQLQKEFEYSTIEQCKVIKENTKVISGSIEKQTDILTNQLESLGFTLEDIAGNILKVGEFLGIGINNLLESQKITNQYLKNIQTLSSLPDDEKKRHHSFNKGMKDLSYAIHYDNLYYRDALVELEKSNSIDGTDYLVLYALGQIHLLAPFNDIYNLDKAKEYFQECSRRAEVEYKHGIFYINNYKLNSNIFVSPLAERFSINEIRDHFFQAKYHIAYIFYIQRNFEEARSISLSCLEIIPNSALAYYMLGKSYYKLGDKEKFLENIKQSIKINRNMAIEAGEIDKEICTEPAIVKLLIGLKQETKDEFNDLLNSIKDYLLPNSKSLSLFNEISENVEDSYLGYKLGVDYINQIQNYNFENVTEKAEDGKLKLGFFTKTVKFKLIELAKYEFEESTNVAKVKKAIELIEIKNKEIKLLNECKKELRELEKGKIVKSVELKSKDFLIFFPLAIVLGLIFIFIIPLGDFLVELVTHNSGLSEAYSVFLNIILSLWISVQLMIYRQNKNVSLRKTVMNESIKTKTIKINQLTNEIDLIRS